MGSVGSKLRRFLDTTQMGRIELGHFLDTVQLFEFF